MTKIKRIGTKPTKLNVRASENVRGGASERGSVGASVGGKYSRKNKFLSVDLFQVSGFGDLIDVKSHPQIST